MDLSTSNARAATDQNWSVLISAENVRCAPTAVIGKRNSGSPECAIRGFSGPI
jgi:hypothetical protein